MKIGAVVGNDAASADAAVGQVRAVAQAGLDSAFFSQYAAWDAVSLAMLSGYLVPHIEVGTAIVQTYPRHPLALAVQALTAQAATGNRFTLGVGPSHPPIVEGQFGYSYDQPARHVREYLSALGPLLRGEAVEYHGETLTAVGQVQVPGTVAPSLLLAALGPVMLRIAGELADGTVTVWTGPEVLGDHIEPTISRAAAAAGRPAPRVAAMVLMSVTADPDAARQWVVDQVGFASNFPAYRSVLDRQGKSGVHETIVAGDEAEVAQAIKRYEAAGTTELLVRPFGSDQEQVRTLKLVASLRKETFPTTAAAVLDGDAVGEVVARESLGPPPPTTVRG